MNPLLMVDGLKIHSIARKGTPSTLVDGVSFELGAGEILGIAGSPASSLSSLLQGCSGYLPDTLQRTSGLVRIEGKSVYDLDPQTLRSQILGSRIAMIPGNIESVLPPFQTLLAFGMRMVKAHFPEIPAKVARERIQERFRLIGLDPLILDHYPLLIEKSTLAKSIIGIATLLNPQILAIDALGSLVQDCKSLLKSLLQQEMIRSLILVSSDPSILHQMCTKVAIFYGGEFVEIGTTQQILQDPKHPYSMQVVQNMDWRPASPPSPSGCRFHPNCPGAHADCKSVRQTLRTVSDRDVRCMYSQ